MIFNRSFSNLGFPIPSELANEDKWLALHALYLDNISVKHISAIGCYFRIHDNNSSIKLDSFLEKNELMHRRFIVYKIFLNKYKDMLNKGVISELEAQDIAEKLRYEGKWISILFIQNISIKQKLRFIIYSNSFFYKIRMKMFSLFSGWGI